MKTLFVTYIALLLTATTTQSQNRFYVKGNIEGINDGEVLALYLYRDGSINASSIDTIKNGSFFLTDTCSHAVLYWVMGMGDRFPPLSLEVWAVPGKTITVKGSGYLIKTWNVHSPSAEQKEENLYLKATRKQWHLLQQLQIEERKIRSSLKTASTTEKDSLNSSWDVMGSKMDSLRSVIQGIEIGLMQKRPVTKSWTNKMEGLALSVNLNPQTPQKEAIMQLYKRIPSAQLKNRPGEKITASLFPPPVVKPGERMADALLLDMHMTTHKLADYKDTGKFLLLEFGFVNCGPCRAAIPETRAIADSLREKLTVIGINTDETDYWKAAGINKEISWINLNDNKGRNGLAARYGARGYPCYIMISPEGIVLGKWEGYERGSLIKKVSGYIQ